MTHCGVEALEEEEEEDDDSMKMKKKKTTNKSNAIYVSQQIVDGCVNVCENKIMKAMYNHGLQKHMFPLKMSSF